MDKKLSVGTPAWAIFTASRREAHRNSVALVPAPAAKLHPGVDKDGDQGKKHAEVGSRFVEEAQPAVVV
jgi:hypothetical protein